MATLNLQVSASTDDCARELTPGYWNLTYISLWAGKYDATDYKYGGGMRFTNVTIPNGATISQAHLALRCRASTSGIVCNTRISAEDVDDAPTFADDSAAFDARWATRTTARVDWDAIPAWTAGADYDSPDIKTVIQEIINRPGWVSGNDIVIFWDDFDNRSTLEGGAGGSYRMAQSYDGSITYAPKLVITYTTGEAKTSGDSGSGAEAISSRELGTEETGSGVEMSLAAAALLASDGGSGSEMGGLLKGLFSQDEGCGSDSIRVLSSKAGHDLRLQSYQGQVSMPHKEVKL